MRHTPRYMGGILLLLALIASAVIFRVYTTPERQTTEATPLLMEPEKLREMTLKLIETETVTLSGLSQKIGVNKGQVYRFLKESQKPSETLHAALSAYVHALETSQEQEETA